MRQKITVYICLIFLMLNLTACIGGPEMPMEVTVDGYDIVIGKTTMQDLIDQGYEVSNNGSQDVAEDGDAYISFYYSLDKGAGHQFWVTVSVPWSGNTDISAESAQSATEGIVQAVQVKKSSTEDIAVTYNGVQLSDMSFDTAAEWGAKEKEDQSVKTYQLTAKQGFLTWEAVNTSDEDFNELRIQMNKKEFEKMQKS
ncbi:MAG: hypothetical protein HFI74_04160 [Lachnospiraceae bacterium]|nr:hypothetical protein [Lachnospiraceae bacterium]